MVIESNLAEINLILFNSRDKWVFPKIGVPPRWMVQWKTLLKWMIWGGSPYFWIQRQMLFLFLQGPRYDWFTISSKFKPLLGVKTASKKCSSKILWCFGFSSTPKKKLAETVAVFGTRRNMIRHILSTGKHIFVLNL